MSISIDIDFSALKRSFGEVPQKVIDHVRKEIKYQLVEIQKDARSVHRHKTHTGMLNESIQADLMAANELGGSVEIMDVPVEYGKFVHGGHGTWAPDLFLYEAIERREDEVRGALQNAVNDALREAGL